MPVATTTQPCGEMRDQQAVVDDWRLGFQHTPGLHGKVRLNCVRAVSPNPSSKLKSIHRLAKGVSVTPRRKSVGSTIRTLADAPTVSTNMPFGLAGAPCERSDPKAADHRHDVVWCVSPGEIGSLKELGITFTVEARRRNGSG